MRALVMYESMFGNTAAVARAVADGLSEVVEVELCETSKEGVDDRFDLIVAGGPTHTFSLSRPSTRRDAVAQGATGARETGGLREWLGDLPRAGRSVAFAAFDTKVDKMRRLPGSAAAKATRIARHLGYAIAGQESFYVAGTTGPLVPGELERARAWGVHLATQVSDRAAERSHG